MKRSYILAIAFTLLLIALIVIAFPTVHHRLNHDFYFVKFYWYHGNPIEFEDGRRLMLGWGWYEQGSKTTMEQPFRAWYADTGYLAAICDGLEESSLMTNYRVDGTVYQQVLGDEHRVAPPWLNGVTDQSHPTAPWHRDEVSVEEWWRDLPGAKLDLTNE